VIGIRTEKTGEPIAIVVQLKPAATLEVGPAGEMTFIPANAGGRW
jgi:hypothetical protein